MIENHLKSVLKIIEGKMVKEYILWDEVKSLSDELAQKIKSHCEDLSSATLVAVSRGGLVPAQLIAYKLNIKDIRIMKLASYSDKNERSNIVDSSTDRLYDGRNVYVIDDLADSGETIRYIRQNYPSSNICTMLVKTCCSHAPDITTSKVVEEGTWLVFPWDE